MVVDVRIDLRRVCELAGITYPSPEELGVSGHVFIHMSDSEVEELYLRWFEVFVSKLDVGEVKRIGSIVSLLMLEDDDYKREFKKDFKRRLKKKCKILRG